jgi:hypothetical protein
MMYMDTLSTIPLPFIISLQQQKGSSAGTLGANKTTTHIQQHLGCQSLHAAGLNPTLADVTVTVSTHQETFSLCIN